MQYTELADQYQQVMFIWDIERDTYMRAMTTNMLCDTLGVTNMTLWNWGKKGLKTERAGRQNVYKMADLREFLPAKYAAMLQEYDTI